MTDPTPVRQPSTALQPSVLVVDDDLALGRVLLALLRQAGLPGEHVSSAARALAELERRPFDVVLTDLRMPGMDGMTLLSEIGSRWPGQPVLLLTAHGNVPTAVEAMRRGAAGFLLKPFQREQILFEIRKAAASVAPRDESPPELPTSGELIAESPVMQEVLRLVQRAAGSSASVLLRGESGTGKERLVELIHSMSPRSAKPLIRVHCAALPDTLIEDELFGHEKGAFTGAIALRQGRVELADGGTLFLDEVGDIALGTQVKLLRLLQERTFERLGGAATQQADVRFVAATHQDLEALCQRGTFREDLFYRLDVVPIWVPPLRERGDDVLRLLRHYFARFVHESQRELSLADDALNLLAKQPWPGNVRELRNFVERLVVLAADTQIRESDVRRELARLPLAAPLPAAEPGVAPVCASLDETRREAERRHLEWALDRCGGHRTQAARICGVSRSRFYLLLQRYGLDS